MNSSEYFASHQGQMAREILIEAKTASILGSTSRGIFLKVNLHKMVFLSFEDFHGPLTINMQCGRTPFAGLENNNKIVIEPGNINFPELRIQILVSKAEIWDPLPNNHSPLSLVERNSRIKTVARLVRARSKGDGLMPALADFFGFEESIPHPVSPFFDWVKIQQLHETIHQSNEGLVFSNLSRFFGLGSGLTPSGDDLINGFLLTCNRFPHLIQNQFNLTQLNELMLASAYQKTSLLSANLIECATLGLGDERLLTTLDGLLFGTTDPIGCADLLLNWGSSSGCDAFTGMVLAAYHDPLRTVGH